MPRTELRSEVEVAASPQHVYAVLTDFAQYHAWNPFLTSVTGPLEVGRKLSVELSLPEGKAYRLEPQVTHVTERELGWSSRFLSTALLEAEHFFSLRERDEGVTCLVQGLTFSGLLLRFSGNALTQAARGCVYMNQALKKRAESTWVGGRVGA